MVGGETTAAHRAVGALVVCSGERCASFCSGTLVASNWVVTAGHCVEAILEDYRELDVAFASGGDVREADGRDNLVQVSTGLLHPHYGDLDHDIGLVKLVSDIDGVTQPVSISPPVEAWLGTPLRYVGYGVTSDEADDAGVKRRTDIPLQDWDEQWLMAEDPDGETNMCWGDSGGAAMLPLEGGGFALVGVQSWVWDNDSTPCTGGRSGATRVDAHIDWLASEAPLELVVIEEPEQTDEEEQEVDEEEEEHQEDEEEGQEEEEEQNQDDTGWADEEEGREPGRTAIPDDGPSLDSNEPTVGGGFQRTTTSCNTSAPKRAPWLPAILAVMAGLMVGRRRT